MPYETLTLRPNICIEDFGGLLDELMSVSNESIDTRDLVTEYVCYNFSRELSTNMPIYYNNPTAAYTVGAAEFLLMDLNRLYPGVLDFLDTFRSNYMSNVKIYLFEEMIKL